MPECNNSQCVASDDDFSIAIATVLVSTFISHRFRNLLSISVVTSVTGTTRSYRYNHRHRPSRFLRRVPESRRSAKIYVLVFFLSHCLTIFRLNAYYFFFQTVPTIQVDVRLKCSKKPNTASRPSIISVEYFH